MAEHDADQGPNTALIGVPGSRSNLSTPCLLVDLDRFDRNLDAMADHARRAGVALRPHAKAHKSLAIARRQLAAGAIGIACTTLGEAEVMAGAGLPGILITSPVVAPPMIDRLIGLLKAGRDVTGVAEDPANLDRLETTAATAGCRLPLLVDIDVGQRRTGVVSTADAVTLTRRIADSRHLRYDGIQAYWGHLQQVSGFDERARAVTDAATIVRAAIAALTAAGLPPAIVTGGGTGTMAIDAGLGLFTELQPGSYLFMDASYVRPQLWPGAHLPFQPSLFVRAHVVSVLRPDHAVINAGLKAFATDSGVPMVDAGTYRFMGDEHGAIAYADAASPRLRLGDAVELLVPHCDPTVNLHDVIHGVRGDRLVEILRVDARGR